MPPRLFLFSPGFFLGFLFGFLSRTASACFAHLPILSYPAFNLFFSRNARFTRPLHTNRLKRYKSMKISYPAESISGDYSPGNPKAIVPQASSLTSKTCCSSRVNAPVLSVLNVLFLRLWLLLIQDAPEVLHVSLLHAVSPVAGRRIAEGGKLLAYRQSRYGLL